MKKFPCKICDTMSIMEPLGSAQGNSCASVKCPQCGDYNSHASIALNLNARQKANASGWMRENRIELLTQSMANEFSKLKTPTAEKRIYLLLNWILKKTDYSLGGIVTFPFSDVIEEDEENELLGYCYCLDKNELRFLFDFLIEKNFIGDARQKYNLNTNSHYLTFDGLNYFNKLQQELGSNTGFCAMWFSPEVAALWSNAIYLTIETAGYNPVIVNELNHLSGISDEALAQIRKSRFIVADLTGERPNVYYEAGFARGLNIPVIFTCRKDHFDEKSGKKIHFDIKHLNILEWDPGELEDFKNRLKIRIESNFGLGKKKSNIEIDKFSHQPLEIS